MSLIHFIFLPDIVLLEVFSYLSCKHALYAFTGFSEHRLDHLLRERGAFKQIHVSSHINCEQFNKLATDIWRYDDVRSLVCDEVFSDFGAYLIPQLSPLSKLRLLSLRCAEDALALLIRTQSSTLTHLSVSENAVSSISFYRSENLRTGKTRQ